MKITYMEREVTEESLLNVNGFLFILVVVLFNIVSLCDGSNQPKERQLLIVTLRHFI